MNLNDKLKLEKFGMTHNQIRELKSFLVERYVDNMSTKDLVSYVTDDLDRYYAVSYTHLTLPTMMSV